jgi:hypothetical protein
MDSAAESKQPDTADDAAVINLLRRFHYGEPAAAETTTAPAGAILPALLNLQSATSTRSTSHRAATTQMRRWQFR